MAYSELWYSYEQSKLTTTQCYRQLDAQHGVSEEEIDSTFRQSTACLTPNPRMTQLLPELTARGLIISMMTYIPHRDFDQLRSTDYEWNLFDTIHESDDVGMQKPDHACYTHALQEIGVSPAEAIFIDDKDENVVAARGVGMIGVLFQASRAPEICDEIADMLDAKPAVEGE